VILCVQHVLNYNIKERNKGTKMITIKENYSPDMVVIKTKKHNVYTGHIHDFKPEDNFISIRNGPAIITMTFDEIESAIENKEVDLLEKARLYLKQLRLKKRFKKEIPVWKWEK